MPPKTAHPWKRWHTLFLLGFVIIIAYLTYFHRYTEPQAPYWDENYYITDAQREMNDMFYMQIHPPMGKLLIAWGEELYTPFATGVNNSFRPPATTENTWCCIPGNEGQPGQPVNLVGEYFSPGETCARIPSDDGGSLYRPFRPTAAETEACKDDVFQVNTSNSQFLDTEHAGEFPKDFAFAGYRLFPALLAWLGAPLLFLIFLFITRNPLLSGFLSFLYIFDNALIVHHRGAMLDGPALFFIILAIFAFFLVLRSRGRWWPFLLSSALFGAALALGFTTKYQNAIMVLLVPFLLWKLWPSTRVAKGASPSGTSHRYDVLHFLWASAAAFLFFFVGTWQIHFAHMVTINPALSSEGYYQASHQYKTILAAGKQGSLLSFPVMLRDSFRYVSEYNKGIPKLDLCKPDENGSPWFLWPVGATAINYRWETPDGQKFQYLYLVSNPVVWFTGLLAVILSIVYLLMPVFSTQRTQAVIPSSSSRSDERTEGRFLILTFTTLYLAYMAAMSLFERVMFLYSYFPALVFSFVLIALVLMELRVIGRLRLSEEQKVIGVGVLAALIFVVYQFFRPLTYYEPMTDRQIARRAWLPIWQLHCVNCGNEGPLVKHRCEQQ